MKPEEKTQTTLRLPKELHKILINTSKKLGISLNAVIVSSLWKIKS